MPLSFVIFTYFYYKFNVLNLLLLFIISFKLDVSSADITQIKQVYKLYMVACSLYFDAVTVTKNYDFW